MVLGRRGETGVKQDGKAALLLDVAVVLWVPLPETAKSRGLNGGSLPCTVSCMMPRSSPNELIA